MLKRMELWDFESHKHTVVDDFSAGLNLVCGESNAGKTSLVRALKLVAYNEFDPHSIRVGATKCKVLVETDKGTVKVTRGSKNNLWEITKNGQPTQYFDKVGVDVVPAAVEVMGLNMVSLGDVQVPVNIMDQLESHFMLKGVGDKNASGSMRAQIVDEISGLSGIEGLIKSVSLDNYRFGREVTEIEGRMEEVRKQLHDEKMMGEESDRLGKVEKMLDDADDLAVAVENMTAMDNEFKSLAAEIQDKTAQLDALPDYEAAMDSVDKSAGILKTVVEMEKVERECLDARKKVDELESKMSKMPDVEKAMADLKKAEGILVRASDAERLAKDAQDALGRVVGLKGELDKLGDFEKARDAIEKAGGILERVEEMEKMERECLEAKRMVGELEEAERKLGNPEKAKEMIDRAAELMESVVAMEKMERECLDAKKRVDELEQKLKECDERYEIAVKRRDEAIGAIKVCPLTLSPISEECIKEAKGV